MFQSLRRRAWQRAEGGPGKRVLHFETLENRALLSIAGPAGSNDPGQLIVDTDVYDASSILVRFREQAFGGIAAGGRFHEENVVAGTSVQPGRSLAPGLRQVQLSAGIDVAAALAAYRANPNVLYAEPNYRVHVTVTPDDPRLSELWGLENTGQTGGTADADVDAPRAWETITGTGDTVVAVIDTGVDYTHQDLAANMWVNPGETPGDGIDNDGNGFVDDVYGYDFANDDGDPMDDHDHGTHVAGTIGAAADNGVGVAGVSWNVDIMAVKFLDATGYGTTADAIDAINYAVDAGAHVSNNSWGDNEEFSQALYETIAAARNAGHVLVAAAANGNALGIGQDNDLLAFYPANYDLDNIVSVAATDHNDAMATFSNFGATTVDLTAPGVDILSTTRNNTYATRSGTSMAAPYVTGVLALVRDLNPAWTYQQIIDQVLSTVEAIPAAQGLTVTGGGLNAAAAVGNPEPPPPPPPPTALPVWEGFADGVADHFLVRSGNWDVSGGRYNVAPVVSNDELGAVTTLLIEEPVPDDLEIQATVNADEGRIVVFGIVLRDDLTNGFVVFDYQDHTDFKFAGADMNADRWVIGHYDQTGWHQDAFLSQVIDAATDYRLRVVIEAGNQVALHAGGVPVVSHTFVDTLTDGLVGLGMKNSNTHFDDVVVQQYFPPPPPVPLPIHDDFEDGQADNFLARSGVWRVDEGRYQVTPLTDGDGVSTARIEGALPAELEVQTTFNAEPNVGGRYSDAFVIFDYQGPADFKFAGAYVGSDKWVIGHRTSSTWIVDASVVEVIDANTDYRLDVLIRAGGEVTLSVGGVEKVSHQFSGPLDDGEVGLGTWDAVSRFDDVMVREYVPPPPPPSTTLPMQEDFEDGLADFFEARAGSWEVLANEYSVTPAGGGDGVSTVRIEGAFPAELEVQTTFNADPNVGSRYSDGFVIFDYQGPTDFKFAGAYVGSDKWVIGHRTSSTWVVDASAVEVIDANTDYRLEVLIQAGGEATLSVGGVEKVSHQFSGPLDDGEVGLGTWNAVSRFDDVVVREYVPPPPPASTTLPMQEDFEDGLADFFEARSGSWQVLVNEYSVTPASGGDGVSTVRIEGALPAELEVQTTFNADPNVGSRYSDGFVIFDYQGPADFKFAGAYVGSNLWVIGHRTSSTWIVDASVGETINANTDYRLDVVIQAGGEVTLSVGGVEKVSHQFSGLLDDGEVGVGTWNAISRFDDVVVQQYVPPPPPPSTTLPVQEDFEDGLADFFEARAGSWSVDGGRYQVTPLTDGDGVSTVRIEGALPAELEVQTTFNANTGGGGRYSDAFVIFDYQGPAGFKFAGAYVGSNLWVIGHRTSSTWIVDASVGEMINANTDYRLEVLIQAGGDVMLSVGGVEKVSHQFSSPLDDGEVGLGTWDAISRFDDVVVREYVPPPPPPPPASTTLPMQEDFEDALADFFEARSGSWAVLASEYSVTPASGGDGVSTVRIEGALPAALEVQTTFNANAGGGGRYSDAFVIFDYQGPADFKFAGAYVGSNKWVIGHRTSTTWNVDASVLEVIHANTDYRLGVVIRAGGEVTLSVGGMEKVS
ncbi:MAG: S8 family peptidase, partial [Planctomycetota bacterium]